MGKAIVIPFPNQNATESQIFKLLTMLSLQRLIGVEWVDRVPVHNREQAVEWVNDHMDFGIEDLEDLTREQIQECYEELE
jgi:hypothetical protein